MVNPAKPKLQLWGYLMFLINQIIIYLLPFLTVLLSKGVDAMAAVGIGLFAAQSSSVACETFSSVCRIDECADLIVVFYWLLSFFSNLLSPVIPAIIAPAAELNQLYLYLGTFLTMQF